MKLSPAEAAELETIKHAHQGDPQWRRYQELVAKRDGLTKPTIHLNGSNGRSLFDGYQAAYDYLRGAQSLLAATGPHGRDYYPQGDEALSSAIAEHAARQQRLESLVSELEQLAIHCYELIQD